MSAASDDEPEVPPPMGESTFTCEEKFQVTNNKGQHKAVFEVCWVDVGAWLWQVTVFRKI